MNRYYYDLHMHSCLSPCADDDMTPANIAGMASLCGLQLVALTDHNTCGSCRAFVTACRQYGIVGVPGMELTTAEEIHRREIRIIYAKRNGFLTSFEMTDGATE